MSYIYKIFKNVNLAPQRAIAANKQISIETDTVWNVAGTAVPSLFIAELLV